MVSKELLEELRIIIKKDYKINLKPKEVSEIGNSLVSFFELLLKIESDNKAKKTYGQN